MNERREGTKYQSGSVALSSVDAGSVAITLATDVGVRLSCVPTGVHAGVLIAAQPQNITTAGFDFILAGTVTGTLYWEAS